VGSGLLLLGEILRPWGRKGEVKLLPYGDLREALLGRDGLFLEKGSKILFREVEEYRFHKSFVILKFKGHPDYESVEELGGWKAGIPRSTAPPAPPDTYYHYDIIGLEVISGREAKGKITEIWNTGANDVYLVEKEGREWFLPATKEIIQRVDLEKGKIHVELPEGLMDLEEV